MKSKILFIGSQCVKRQSQDLACEYETFFLTQLIWQWSKNPIKVMWCRFQQWFGTFTLFLVEGFSEMVLFRHLSNHVFGVRNFGNTKPMRVILFFKTFKFEIDFKNADKNREKFFSFSDNSIWIGIVKLSLFTTGYI